eukprot:Platyproteum_vivax@DN3080_c1_g1_i1.p1
MSDMRRIRNSHAAQPFRFFGNSRKSGISKEANNASNPLTMSTLSTTPKKTPKHVEKTSGLRAKRDLAKTDVTDCNRKTETTHRKLVKRKYKNKPEVIDQQPKTLQAIDFESPRTMSSLQECRDVMEEIIEKDVIFGKVLRRIMNTYEAALLRTTDTTQSFSASHSPLYQDNTPCIHTQSPVSRPVSCSSPSETVRKTV